MPTTATLYEISEELHALREVLEASDGDVTNPAVEAAIDTWQAELHQNRDQKIDNYCALITQLEYDAGALTAEADRLSYLAMSKRVASNAMLNQADHLRARLLGFLQVHGIRRLPLNRFRVSRRGNGGLQPLVITETVPQEWVESEVVEKPNKEAIRTFLESGEKLPFAHLGQRKERLVIE